MKKIFLLLALTGFAIALMLPSAVSKSSDVSVGVDDQCKVGLTSFKQPGVGGEHKYIGLNDTGYFSGDVANLGNMHANVTVNISVTRHENRTLELPENDSEYEYVIPPYDIQPENASYVFSLPENKSLPYYHTENQTSYESFLTEFQSFYEPGNYTGRVNVSYNCGNTSKNTRDSGTFEILDLSGEGVIPDAIGEADEEVNQEVDTDAQLPDNATTEFEADANETLEDADTKEGSNENFPGQTEVPEPEPEPEPDPVPLLSVDIKPHKTTYTTPKGRFAEIGLNVTNTGEETLNSLRLEPRFTEGMAWEAQDVTVDSLGVDETANRSVYVSAGESVEAGMYQIPVYASNPENDIGNQYVNVEITEEIFKSALTIEEAPQDIRFEVNQNYSIPVLLENDGDSGLFPGSRLK